jgi:hypothetical protein
MALDKWISLFLIRSCINRFQWDGDLDQFLAAFDGMLSHGN